MATPEAKHKTEMNAPAAVAQELARTIMQSMPAGTSLPSEAKLAERFEVSRLTIREALKMLAGRGLVDMGRGRKARTRAPDGSAFSDFLTATILKDGRGLFDLMEMRLALETQSAALAAKRATRVGISMMKNALGDMREAAKSDGELGTENEIRFNEADIRFHESIAIASGNRVLTALFEGLTPPLFEAFVRSRQGQKERGQSAQDTIAAHQAIFDAVAAGNEDDAALAMQRHMEETSLDITVGLKFERESI